ncbi:MAG: fasciclin domain-containing protein [bacterium]|nr:fasciclin domain-containing protein [bacterium]
MKKALLVLTVVLALFGAFSVFAQEEAGTIADIVVASTSADPAEFTILLAAVQAADPAVLELLSNADASVTVFAPTDAAFAAAFEALGVTAEDVLADPVALTDILLYHVVPGEFNAEAVVALDGALLGTALYETALTVSLDGETVRINNAAVVAADVAASNGIVHVIDGVLLPPSDMEMAMATEEPMMMETVSIAETVIAAAGAEAPEFTVLLAAVQAADPSVLEALTNGGPFTVFAPTDAAFAAALEALGVTAEDLLANTELLTSVLAYHVLPGHFSASTVVAAAGQEGGVRVATLNAGLAVTIAATDAGVTVDSANVVTTDIHASNGIVHVIDAVILPPADM